MSISPPIYSLAMPRKNVVSIIVIFSTFMSIAFFFMPDATAGLEIFNPTKIQDTVKKRQILQVLKHYLKMKIPREWTIEPSEWSDGSGISIDLRKKASESDQHISLSVVKNERNFTLPELVTLHLAGGGVDFGSINLSGTLWRKYTTGTDEGIDRRPHHCRATVVQDMVIWTCLSPEDLDHPSSGISVQQFDRFVKSFKVNRNAYFTSSVKYSETLQFNHMVKKFHRCSDLRDDQAWNSCLQQIAEKSLLLCQKFKRDCEYLTEHVKEVKLLSTDEASLPSHEIFNLLSSSLDSLQRGGGSLPRSEE